VTGVAETAGVGGGDGVTGDETGAAGEAAGGGDGGFGGMIAPKPRPSPDCRVKIIRN
jgi:hypothetical protein